MVKYLSKLSYLNTVPLTYAECQTFTDIEYNRNRNLIKPLTESEALNNLLSTVTYKEKEEELYLTDYYKTLFEYFEYDVYTNLGISLKDVLNMDSDIYADIINMLIIKLQAKAKVIDDLKKKHDNKPDNVDTFSEYDTDRLNGINF